MNSERLVSFGISLVMIWTIACSVNAKEQNILVGSIPGDAIAKQMLGIDAGENIDFIRLRIALNEGDRKFDLSAAYGIGKPNTRDFENGGKSMSAKGNLEIKDSGSYLIYRLSRDGKGIDLTLMRLNDSMFHVLSPNGRLLTGNGGWNYTLSRESGPRSKSELRVVAKKPAGKDETNPIVFVGRTPCKEIARELSIAVTDDCFKLKWKLTLNSDPATGSPTTFTLQRTFRRPEPLEGKWLIEKNGGTVIYKLEATDGQRMAFARFDDSLLFMDSSGLLLKGNGESGYTLDRQKNETSPDVQKAKME